MNNTVIEMYEKTRANIVSNIELCKKNGTDSSESEKCLKQLDDNYSSFLSEIKENRE